VIGFSVAWLFHLFGAPDLAMTQVVVETLTVVLFVLAFYHLPPYSLLSTRRTRIRDAALAVSAGGLVTALLLLVTSFPAPERISEFYARNSVPLAHGANVVNVILVDFRALDTLGEITVLSTAALGVAALLRFSPKGAGRP
jgi:multicomponent Na+:H+ antiporter subunit A